MAARVKKKHKLFSSQGDGYESVSLDLKNPDVPIIMELLPCLYERSQLAEGKPLIRVFTVENAKRLQKFLNQEIARLETEKQSKPRRSTRGSKV